MNPPNVIGSRGLQTLTLLFVSLLITPMVDANPPASGIVLENEAVRVVIDPVVGRVMAFQPKSEASRNLLWTNAEEDRQHEASQAGYENWGGDKVWPVAQPFWRYGLGRIWPPDTAVDGSPAIATLLAPDRVRLVFPPSAHFHSRLEREFALDAEKPILRIRNRITQLHPSPFPAQAWSITQVPLPGRVLLDLAENAPPGVEQPVNLNGISPTPPLSPKPFAEGSLTHGNGWAMLEPPADSQQKIGSLGSWIAGIWPDGVLLQSVAFVPTGMYPEATSLQFYHSDRYGELETLGPARHLRAGETLETDVVWQWLAPADPAQSPADLARSLEAVRDKSPFPEAPQKATKAP